jgi:hypothetical protein
MNDMHKDLEFLLQKSDSILLCASLLIRIRQKLARVQAQSETQIASLALSLVSIWS